MIELNERNKRALIILASFLFVFIFINLVIIPVSDSFDNLDKIIAVKNNQLDEMLTLEKKVKLFKDKSTNSKSGNVKNEFSLYSFMYTLAGKCGLKENINYIKPSSISDKKRGVIGTLVEIELKSVPMEQFTKLLYETEYSNIGLNVTKLSITKTGAQNQGIHVIMHVEYLGV